MITENDGANKILPNVDAKNTTVFDFVVKIKRGNGEWTQASEDELKTGVDAVIPYPENTAKDGFEFVIGHLIVSGDNAGTMEYFKPEKTDAGLKIHITSASPFVIGWKAVGNSEQPTTEAPATQPATEQPATEVTTANGETTQQTESTAARAEAEDAETGDRAGAMIPMLVILMVIALAAAAFVVVDKRKNIIKKN